MRHQSELSTPKQASYIDRPRNSSESFARVQGAQILAFWRGGTFIAGGWNELSTRKHVSRFSEQAGRPLVSSFARVQQFRTDPGLESSTVQD